MAVHWGGRGPGHVGRGQGAQLLGQGVVGLLGSATAATYDAGTGVGTATRVDSSNQSYVQWTGLPNVPHSMTIANTGGSANMQVRAGTHSGAQAFAPAAGVTTTALVTPASGTITITYNGAAGTCTFTVSSLKRV